VIALDGGVIAPPDSGTAGDSGTATCALYGQSCATVGCCNGVPCDPTLKVCRYP
jgi:hypothetical protein